MITGLITFIVYVIILGVIIWLLRYIVNNIPWIDEGFRKVIMVAITVISVLILLVLFLNLLPIIGVHNPLPTG